MKTTISVANLIVTIYTDLQKDYESKKISQNEFNDKLSLLIDLQLKIEEYCDQIYAHDKEICPLNNV